MTDCYKKQEEVAEFYDEEANSYDERFNSPAGKYIHERQVSIILEQLGDIEGKTVLEIAAGTGRFTHELVEQGANVIVVDVAREMLEQNRDTTPGATFIHGTGTSLPLGDETIDACVTVNSLNHIPGHWNVVDDVYRVLRSDGIFLANYPNLLSNRLPTGLYVNHKNRNIGGGVYTKWFNIFTVKSRLAKAGYSVEACTGDRLIPVKAASKVTIPIARVTERFAGKTALSNLCVSPFVTAQKP